jgi:hypothetical protein
LYDTQEIIKIVIVNKRGIFFIIWVLIVPNGLCMKRSV